MLLFLPHLHLLPVSHPSLPTASSSDTAHMQSSWASRSLHPSMWCPVAITLACSCVQAHSSYPVWQPLFDALNTHLKVGVVNRVCGQHAIIMHAEIEIELASSLWPFAGSGASLRAVWHHVRRARRFCSGEELQIGLLQKSGVQE